MKCVVEVASKVVRSARVAQVEGMFDVPPAERSTQRWDVDLPCEERPWSIGLIVGPSGCGKSTVARQLFPEQVGKVLVWDPKCSILDAFPKSMGIRDVVAVLSSVGFSSPPSWLRPFHALSNGEQFRVTLARLLAESPELVVVDEYTSVVDRNVARIGSAAVEKSVRRRGGKFVAVSCHEDVEEWLRPDWVYRPSDRSFSWRFLQRRPAIELDVRRVDPGAAWKLFAPHHYLSSAINRSSTAFVAWWQGVPVAFDAWLPHVGRTRDRRQVRRGHRTVCLPDYQGVGIGAALFRTIASMWAGLGMRAISNTGHPAEIASRTRSPEWVMIRAPGTNGADFGTNVSKARTLTRFTASFEYVGDPMPTREARELFGC